MPNVAGVIVLLLAWVALELVVWLVRRRAARRVLPPRARARTGEPSRAALAPRVALARRARPCVVLVHGFGGFDELRALGRRAAYFRGVRRAIEARGLHCVVPRLPPVASIERRADALARVLAALGDADAYVIAHSMGGLDARFALARHAPPNVRALVTVATPHRGTPLADLGARLAARAPFADLSRALADLAPARVAALEGEMRDADGVRYASVVVAPARAAVHPLLVPSHRLLSMWAGDNDGVVPVASQAWGEVLERIDTDHWGAVGWGPFDAPAFYASLAEHVAYAPAPWTSIRRP